MATDERLDEINSLLGVDHSIDPGVGGDDQTALDYGENESAEPEWDDEGESEGEAQAYEPMSEDDLLKAVYDEVMAASQDQMEREQNQANATEYFYGRLPGLTQDDVDAGMADMVSTDVGDAVESVLAEIMPAFTGQAPVEFVPASAEDEMQADVETRAVNYVAAGSGSYMAINQAVKDALLRRVGIIKVWWEDIVTVRYEPLKDVQISMLPALMQEKPGEVVEIADGDLNEQTGMVTGNLRRYTKKSKPKIEAVPRDEFLISNDANQPNAEMARFVAHQRPVSRSYLVQLGFDREEVAELKSYDGSDNPATVARARSYADMSPSTIHDKTGDQVMVVEAYYEVDYDGDGIAERRRVFSAGGTDGTDELMLNEPWDQQPFCIGVPYLGIYSWDGVSLYDKLKGIQDSKTSLIRDVLNASKRNVRQRVGVVDKMVNMNDMLTSVMGGVVRIKDPSAIVPIPDVIVPPMMFNTLNYLDEVRRDKGGGAIDSAAQVNAIAGDTAHGMERSMSAYEAVNAMVAKNLAETMVKALFLKLHNLLRQYQQNPVVVPGSTGWQTANPRQWNAREDVVVSLGMSVGERTRRSAALGGILQAQVQAMQSGMDGTLVTPENVYQTLIDAARMAGLPSPEQYWTNPQSPGAQQASQQKQQSAQQNAQMQQQATQAQLNVPIQMEQIKAQGAVQAAQIRADSQKEIEGMKAQLDQMQASVQNIMDMLNFKLKLVEANAKYDGDPVPDTLAELGGKEMVQ